MLLQVRLHRGRALPDAAGDLVAAHVEVAQGHAGLAVEGHEVLHHALHERVGGGESRVHHVVVVALGRGVGGAVPGVAQAEAARAIGVAFRLERSEARLHRLDGGARVAGHLELGDHLDVPRRGVPQDLRVVGARVEAAPVGPVDVGPGAPRRGQEAARVEGVAAPRADGRELGKARDLHAPGLVLGEVEVER